MQWIKKHKIELLSFFIPMAFLFLFFAWKGCFTSKNILNSDMHAQYLPLFQYLKNVLKGVATFPYTFSKGLGGEMYGAFFYYLSNPLNFFVCFFEDIPLFLTLLVILKLSLAGLTMSIFLKYQFPKAGNKVILFALAYVFMNYNINYYVNVMWLDGVILAPLLLLGIEKIFSQKRDGLYIICLFLAILFNYYIGYILTLFSLIYFGYRFYILYEGEMKQHYRELMHFVILTFLVGCLTMFILIPCALELINVTRVFSIKNVKWININFLDFVAPTYIGFGNLNNPLNYFGFCIFSGTAMIPLVLSYFHNSKISIREKKATAILYALFLLPIAFPILNMIWHMFSSPVAFNYRYSFLTTLMTLVIAFRSLQQIENPKKILTFYFILFLIFSCSLGYVTFLTPEYYVFLNIYKIIATVLLVGLNILLIVKKKEKLLLIILLFELVVNTVWIGLDSRMGLDEKYWTAKELLDDFSSNCTDLRCEIKGGFSSNDSILGNYHGVSIFLSTANGKPISFLAKASNYTDSRNYYYYHPDLILDMLLGIERIEDTDIVNGYQVLNEQKLYDKTYYLLHNPYALSLGYTVSPKLKDFSSKEEGFFYLEELLNAMIDQNNSYVLSLPLEQMDDHHYQLTVDSTYPYLYLYTDSVPTVNGKEIDNYLFTADDYGVIYLPQEEVISLYFEEQPSHVEIYTISLEQLEQFEKNVTQWNVTENTGNRLTGTIEVEEDTTLLLTIPYEQGWEVYVDGKKTKMFSLLDAFIGIDVLEGTHQITLKYHIPGLALGILVSMISLGILILYEKWGKRRLLFKQ